MNTLIFLGAVQSFFLALFVFTRKGRALPDRLLALLLGLFGLLFLLTYLSLEFQQPDLLLFLVYGGLLIASTFFIYVRALLDPKRMFRRRDYLHFLIYVLSWVYLMSVLFLENNQVLDQYFHEPNPFRRSLVFNLFLLAELGSVPVYVGLTLRLLAQHRANIAQTFAYSEGIDYAWVRFFAKLTLALWFLLTLPDLLHLHLGFLTEQTSLKLSFVLATPLIFYLGFYGFKQTTVFLTPLSSENTVLPLGTLADTATEPQEENSVKYRKATLKSTVVDDKLDLLIRVMTTQKPYLHAKLTLGDLAEMVGMSSHHLSQLVNEHMNVSFYDFVNAYRVDEFKRQISDGLAQKYTILAIATDCGFNSKSSFNRIFKKLTGQTPSHYVKTYPS